jgi:hypothetical protein
MKPSLKKRNLKEWTKFDCLTIGCSGGTLTTCNKNSLSAVKGVEFLEQVTDCCRNKVFALGLIYTFVNYHCHRHC